MRLFASLVLALLLCISLVAPSLSYEHLGRRHHIHRQGDLARRDPGEITLFKRFDNCRFTYFAVGLGSCGANSVSTDFVVALNADQYQSSYCFQTITITANGKSTQATIVDKCPVCPSGGLDLSQGLFEFFADLSVGVLTGSWTLGGSSPPPSPSPSPSPSPPPPPPTTSVDIPTTSLLPSPTTSTSQPPTSTTSSSTTSFSSSSSTSVGSSSSSVAPSQTTSNVVSESGTPNANLSVLSDVNWSIVFIAQFLVDSSGM